MVSSSHEQSEHTLYKSIDLWVLNKPPKAHFDEVVTQCADFEAVHRLDFETSGCLLYAHKDRVPELRASFKSPDCVKKLYWAGARHEIDPQWLQGFRIEGFIGTRYRSSKKARFSDSSKDFQGYHSRQSTVHSVRMLSDDEKESFFKTSKLQGSDLEEARNLFQWAYEVDLQSGSRHQIRAFFEFANAPLKGDPIYNSSDTVSKRLALHAIKLELFKESVAAEAPFYL